MTKTRLLRPLAFVLAALAFLAAPTSGLAEDPPSSKEFYRELYRRDASRRDDATVLLVSGVIGPGSYNEFRAAISRNTPKIIVIEGPGGVLGEALLIGEEIRRRRLDTLVAANHRCASACAVVFLSGHTRYLGAGASVGLHSASFADGRTDPEATQVMAAYLSKLGVPASTLSRMEHTAPSDIRWLTKAEQRAIGIRIYQQAR